MPAYQLPLPSHPPGAPIPPPTTGGMSPSTRAAAAAALRRQHKMTLERKVSDNAVSDTPLSTCTAGPGPNSDEYFGPLAGFTSTASGATTPSLTAITANIATTSERRGPPGTPGRGLGAVAGRQVVPPRLQPLAMGGEKGRRRESVVGGEAGKKKKGVWEHGRGRGEVSLDGEEAEVER